MPGAVTVPSPATVTLTPYSGGGGGGGGPGPGVGRTTTSMRSSTITLHAEASPDSQLPDQAAPKPCGVSTTTVPEANNASHVVGQSMPAGVLSRRTSCRPASATVRRCGPEAGAPLANVARTFVSPCATSPHGPSP